MPVDPQQLQQLVGDPRFQALAPEDQIANFKGFLQEQDPEFTATLDPEGQHSAATQLLTHFQPTFASKVADVAEYFPVMGGAIQGYRSAEAGQPGRPLTAATLGASTNPYVRAGQEAVRDLAELGIAEGATKLAAPLISGLVTKFGGASIESAIAGLAGGGEATAAKVSAPSLVERAFGAPTLAAARTFAGDAARIAVRNHLAQSGLEQLTAGATFGAAQALEDEIAGGQQAPLSDFLKTTLGTAALGLGFVGAGELVRRYGVRSMEDVVGAAQRFDPERFAGAQRQIAEIAEATRRASAGRLDRQAAADLTLGALTDPIAAVGDIRVLKDALRNNPELLGSEVGLHLLRTQRGLTAPDIQFVNGPHMRVTYDDEAGRSVTQDLTGDHAAQRAFAERVRAGKITIDSAVGDQASILRAGIREGSPLAERVPPGGGAKRPTGEEPPTQLEVSGQVLMVPGDAVDQAARELRPAPVVTRSVSDLAASPEAISRLAAERRTGITYALVHAKTGKEIPVPATVDRVDVRPGPNQVLVKRGASPNEVIVDAGARVRPDEIARIRAREQAKFESGVAQRIGATRGGQLALPGTTAEYGTLLPDGRVVEIRAGPVAVPARGTIARSSAGESVTVASEPDVLGRAVVTMPGGRSARVEWNGLRGHFDLPEYLLSLPAREGVAPPRTMEVPMLSNEFRAQVAAGQIVHQTIADMGKRGALPSIEILAVDGDNVLVRAGSEVRDATIDDVARTIEGGTGKFAFDMTKSPTDILETMNERFAARVRERPIVDAEATPAQLAADAQFAAELFAFDKRSGLDAGPATLAADNGEGLKRKVNERKNRPAEERTRSKSDLVKGCKP